MKIVVIGGTGLIGSKLVAKLNEHGHEAVAAAPNTGVNTITGEGLAEVLAGTSVIVDVSNSPSFETEAVMKFFETSTRNLLAAGSAAGVKHHVALSVVGTDRLPDSGYFRAKLMQEKLIKESAIPYSIVHATQFFEFLKGIADSATVDNKVHLAPVLIQPMAADDVAKAVGRVAVGTPVNGIIDIAGPEQFRLDRFIAQGLSERNDPREVVADPDGLYFGARLSERTLVPASEAQIGETYFKDWLAQQPAKAQAPAAPLTLKENEFRLSDVPPGSALRIGDVAVFNVAGSFYVTEARCTHRQGDLAAGKLDGSTVTCPLHGSQFDVTSGDVLRGPAKVSLKTYEVVVDGDIGRIHVPPVSIAKAV